MLEFQLPGKCEISLHEHLPLEAGKQRNIWESVWMASPLLSNLLPLLLELHGNTSSRVLELGSGLGLVSLVASKLLSKSSEIIVTDAAKAALDLLEVNIHANNCTNTKTLLLNWSALDIRTTDRFHYIFGADILYLSASLRPVLKTISQSLDDDDGMAVLVCPGRCFFDEFVQLVEANNSEYGLQVSWRKYENIAVPGLFDRYESTMEARTAMLAKCSIAVLTSRTSSQSIRVEKFLKLVDIWIEQNQCASPEPKYSYCLK